MVLVGACVMPHGALPFDGDLNSQVAACQERREKLPADLAAKFINLYNGMDEAGAAVAAMDPDLIILHTPHGIWLNDAVGVYANSVAEGNALWNNCWSEFKVKLNLDSSRADELYQHLKSSGIPADKICSYSPPFPTVLRWGEVIPAWYIQKHLKKEVKYVIMSQARQPWPVTPSSTEPRLHVGDVLSSFIETLPERVVMVISSDLSHSYISDYPDPLYQADPLSGLGSDHAVACDMERAFRGWARSWATRLEDKASLSELPPVIGTTDTWDPQQALPWIQRAVELQAQGYSCGLVGMLALHSLLRKAGDKGQRFSATVTCCEAPTYYCMMAVIFRTKK